MANVQYIGARYVPAFYLNPDDNSNNWKSGVDYENLTVVLSNNNSYTSKKYVPSTVGRPEDNPTYWALTGNYDANIMALQTNFGLLKDKVDSVKFFASYLGIDEGVDCSAQLQDIIDNTSVDTIVFNDGTYYFSNINVTRPMIFSCSNAKIKGNFIVDSNYVTFENCEFEGVATLDAIQVKRSRFLSVHDCIFSMFDKVFNVLPLNGADYGATSTYDPLFHKVGNWLISDNKFLNVGYVIYQEYYTGLDDPVPMNDRRMRASDIIITDNNINPYNITAFSFMGCDGLQINDNVAFINGNETSNENFLYLREGFFLDVKDNHIWGSGEEGIYIEWCEESDITGNTFANCGIQDTKPAIYFKQNGSYNRALITNNMFSRPSGDAIVIEPYNMHVTITDNLLDPKDNPEAAVNDPDRIFVDSAAIQSIIESNEGGAVVKRQNLPLETCGTSALNYLEAEHEFTTDQEEFELCDLNGSFFNGLILITVNFEYLFSAKNAVYMCLASANGDSSTPIPTISDVTFFKQLDFVGLAYQTGTQQAGDKWCKFSFKMDANKKLIAVSENSLAKYKFRVMLIGNSAFDAFRPKP